MFTAKHGAKPAKSGEQELAVRLRCDVESEFVGPSGPVLEKWAVDVLRAVADRMEKGGFEDGFTDVKGESGKLVGEIYVDYSEGDLG